MNHETRRIQLQSDLDAQKTASERNKLGQFATPTNLAREVVSYGLSLLEQNQPVSFLDPAFGTGAFFAALEHSREQRRIAFAQAFEIDEHYALPTRSFWQNNPIAIKLGDFTAESPNGKTFNLLICNPPYVRHHHITAEQKVRLSSENLKAGVPLSGLAGLYCHFIVSAHKWMADGAIAGWLIPSEFMDVNYGAEVKKYLLERVTLLRIHRFDPGDLQFEDALVSSAVVWIKNSPPPTNHTVEFSYGGTHATPTISRQVSTEVLAAETKWTRFPKLGEREVNDSFTLSDFFDIKRGLATGDNTFFILDREKLSELEVPSEFLQPVLPSPRYLKASIIEGDGDNNPKVADLRFLLNCRLAEDEVERQYPKLWKYLSEGKESLANRYLCRKRKIWYLQEQRTPALFICTYMGRGSAADERPVRFILNKSDAIVTNSYLMLYPKKEVAVKLASEPALLEKVLDLLNAISGEILKQNGRVYGGGLHKMEPSELANLPAVALANLIPPDWGVPRTLFAM